MFNEKQVYAIISAAGKGMRMGADVPKQFLPMKGKTILECTVENFTNNPIVDKVIIVTAGEWKHFCEVLFNKDVEKGKVFVDVGGAERQDSVRNAIRRCEEMGASGDDIILIHDGVRPFASPELTERVCQGAIEHKAVIPGVTPKDTIRHAEEGTLNRADLVCVQTPQGFTFDLINKAHSTAVEEGFYGTDDAGLVERLGYHVAIVPGETGNIKITTPEDLIMENRIGTGYDVHKLVEDRALILGGVNIPYEKGLLGHSDADVLVHALMDAMLGAAAAGDIGKLFPDNDEKFKGISSMKLLCEVNKVLNERGYSLGNADMTIICQKPKLAGYIDDMRSNIAETLNVDIDKISVKATTTEKLGFAGRGEGIAAEAVCILNR